MTRLDRRRLFLFKLSSLMLLLDAHGIPVTVYSFFRTADEQKKLYDEGKSRCDGYIKRSRHQDWLAADLGILNDARTDFLWADPRYDKLGELAEKIGLVWGGRWASLNDVFHVELGEE